MNDPRSLPTLRHTIIVLVVVLLSAGWILPLWMSAESLIDWCRLEAAPVIYGGEGGANSFPFLSFAEQSLVLGALWLALVCVGWSGWLTHDCLRRRAELPAGAENPPRSDRE